jgi:soluble lytic murein transglycosylase-like protein
VVLPVAAAAVARMGAGGVRLATGMTVRTVQVGGRVVAKGVQRGGQATVAAARAGARAGGQATVAGARAGARAGGQAAARGPGSGLRNVRPGGIGRPPRGPRGPGSRSGTAAGGPAGGAGEAAQSADPMAQATNAAGGALRVARRIVGPLSRRLRRRRRRAKKKAHDKAKEKARRLRRRSMRIAVIAGAVSLFMFATSFAYAGTTGPPPGGGGPGGGGPGGGGVSTGAVSGIPYAELFNQTAGLGIDPRLVAAVAWVESDRFAADVISCERSSKKGALGIMQFMPDTAREQGVDPCDPAEAIPGGALYLLQQFDRFGTWELALAAYNAGPQEVADHGGIPPNEETQAYVPKVMNQFEAYRVQFPEAIVSGGGAPGGPMGSTERYTERAITPTTQRLLDAVVPMFGRGYGIGCFRNGTDGEHPKGRACDFIMASPLNTMPTPDYLAHGWEMANWLVANADTYDVYYVIWQEKIWSNSRPNEGWRPYTRYPNGNLQQNHYDHIHVSVY